jgi:TAG lipase/steryl ester hydrolase/phospholipase A2/LPA acyltransferase
MSRIFTTLLFASGLTREEILLVDGRKFLENVQTKHYLKAFRILIQEFILKTLWLLWKLFAPYVLVRQVLAVLILQVTHEGTIPLLKKLLKVIFVKQTKEADAYDKKLATLQQEMLEAESYDEWREAARTLEQVQHQKFQVIDDEVVNTSRVQRMKLKTTLYNRLCELEDADELQYRLRSELHRKHWGMGSTDDATTRAHPQYRAALHDYLDAVCSALALIARGGKKKRPLISDGNGAVAALPQEEADDVFFPVPEEEDSVEKKIAALRVRADFFSETLHSFGRTALLLSGGARLGLLHLGVVRALLDQKLLPRVISGSSAGSIVAVMLGAFRDDELEEKLFDPINLNLRFFALANQGKDENTSASKNPLVSMLLLLPPPLPSIVHGISQVLPFWFSTGTLLDVNVLLKAIRDATGDLTFKEAFEKTGRIINITVSPSGDSDYPMLLNYLTAPRVLIWSASVASCAIPGVFAPVELMAKDMHGNVVPYYHETLKWADGSVESDLPMQRLSELFNINHFVVSQVNPHARFLAPMSRKAKGRSMDPSTFNRIYGVVSEAADETTKVIVNFCRDQSRSSIKHLASAMLLLSPLFPLFSPLKLLGKSVVPILTQKYTGDITIMPPLTFKGMVTILSNPTNEEYLEDLKFGERMTWPHISRMRLHVAIEFLLDDCRQSCRRQLARLEQELLEGGGMSPRIGPRGSFHTGSRDSMVRSRAIDAGGIPTASVLNLHELDLASAVGLPHISSQGVRPGYSRTRRASSIENSANGSQASNPTSPMTTTFAKVPTPEKHHRIAGMTKNSSFLGLSEKLKSRVQSFAEDLSTLGRIAQADSLEGSNHPASLLEVEPEDENGEPVFE